MECIIPGKNMQQHSKEVLEIRLDTLSGSAEPVGTHPDHVPSDALSGRTGGNGQGGHIAPSPDRLDPFLLPYHRFSLWRQMALTRDILAHALGLTPAIQQKRCRANTIRSLYLTR